MSVILFAASELFRGDLRGRSKSEPKGGEGSSEHSVACAGYGGAADEWSVDCTNAGAEPQEWETGFRRFVQNVFWVCLLRLQGLHCWRADFKVLFSFCIDLHFVGREQYSCGPSWTGRMYQ